MHVRWSPEAVSNLERLVFYIAEDSLDAAARIAETVFQRIGQLADFPLRGRAGRKPGTRELVLTPLPYIAVYRITGETVEVLRLWHGAQSRQ